MGDSRLPRQVREGEQGAKDELEASEKLVWLQGRESASQSRQASPWPLCCLQVDILVMAEPSSGRWVHLDTEITNSSGRVTYNVPRPRRLGVGVYPVKMVVRWDPGDLLMGVLPVFLTLPVRAVQKMGPRGALVLTPVCGREENGRGHHPDSL